MARFSLPLTLYSSIHIAKRRFCFICMKSILCPKFRRNISVSASDVLQTSVRGRLVPQVNVLWNNCKVFHYWNKHCNFSRAWWHIFILQWVSGTYSWRNISLVLLAYKMENTSFHNLRNPRFSKLSRNLAPQYEYSTTPQPAVTNYVENVRAIRRRSSGSRLVPRGRPDRWLERQMDVQRAGQTETTKLIVSFRNFLNAARIPFTQLRRFSRRR